MSNYVANKHFIFTIKIIHFKSLFGNIFTK